MNEGRKLSDPQEIDEYLETLAEVVHHYLQEDEKHDRTSSDLSLQTRLEDTLGFPVPLVNVHHALNRLVDQGMVCPPEDNLS